jgi:serine/threonine protein phosphatase 1
MKLFEFIDAPVNGRRFVIGDIHGCCKTLITLIEKQLNYTFDDQLFFLGDYIDRGPDSKGVLDYIMHLMEQGYAVFPLRGNHEQTFLDYNDEETDYLIWHAKKFKLLNLIEDEDIIPKYFTFLNSLLHYYELDNFFIVHGGFNFKKMAPFHEFVDMLWLREFEPNIEAQKRKRVVHGHVPTYLPEIKKAVDKTAYSIPLDNGCVYRKKHKVLDIKKLGHLCALELDTFKLYLQPNIDI